MRNIPLTKGKFALVDDEDYDFLMQYVWRAKTHEGRSRTVYAIRDLQGEGNKWSTIAMHQDVLGKAPEGFVIDHIDENGLNNLRSNLRIVDHSRSRANFSLRSDSTTGYKGVTYNPKGASKWWARTRFQKQIIDLGCFDTSEEAARAYDDKVLELHGECAKLNFPR